MKKETWMKIAGVTALAAAVIGTTAFAGARGIKVDTKAAEYGSLIQTVDVSGYIESEKEKVYYAKVTAPVIAFSVKQGELVQAGELLLRYDTEDLEKNVIQARIQAEAEESGYQGSAAYSSELKSAYQTAVEQEAVYKQAYEAALTNVNDLAYCIETVSEAVSRQRDKINQEIAQVQIEIAQKNAQAANYEDSKRADYLKEAAQLQVRVAGLQKKLTQLDSVGAKPAQNRYFQEADMYLSEIALQRSLLQQEILSTKYAGMNSAQLRQLAKGVELAQAMLQWQEEEADKAAKGITAEFQGVISEVSVEEGAYVTEGSRLFVIKDNKQISAVVEVTKYDMNKITVGQKAEVQIAARSYEGTVSRIRKEAVTDMQDKAKLLVEVHIENPDDEIYLGTEADVTIQTGTGENVLLIPNDALYADDAGQYCYVAENGIAVKKYLACGLVAEDMTEVVSGLQAGEQVITSAMTDENVGKKVN